MVMFDLRIRHSERWQHLFLARSRPNAIRCLIALNGNLPVLESVYAADSLCLGPIGRSSAVDVVYYALKLCHV